MVGLHAESTLSRRSLAQLLAGLGDHAVSDAVLLAADVTLAPHGPETQTAAGSGGARAPGCGQSTSGWRDTLYPVGNGGVQVRAGLRNESEKNSRTEDMAHDKEVCIVVHRRSEILCKENVPVNRLSSLRIKYFILDYP